MSDEMLDMREVRELAHSLADAPRRVQAQAYPAAKTLEHGMTADWRRRWTGIKAMPHIAAAVTGDVRLAGLLAVEVEVGPDKNRRQGALGNIAEFGSSEHAPIRPAGGDVLRSGADAATQLLAEIGKRATL